MVSTRPGRASGRNASRVATDGNAASSVTEFTSTPDALRNMIDWPLLEAAYWHNIPEDPDRQRRRMAELLVNQEFPVELVTGIATRQRHESVTSGGCWPRTASAASTLVSDPPGTN
ncbi:MAG: DUF4433 domain-containing protein [Actinobacteria bacterium]|nr:DUF4433 domain-containing protein [Actinomycetota bacterium]